MDSIRTSVTQTPVSAPSAAPAPAEQTPAPPSDKVEVGSDEPGLGYKMLRGFAGFVAGAATGVVGAGFGAVRHAGDRATELPRAAHSTLRIAGAALGLVRGVTFGLALAGPIGAAVGLVAGPILGAWSGGALAGGVEAVIDAGKGSLRGAQEGFEAGSSWARGLVDSMAGREEPSKSAPAPAPAPQPASPSPDQPKA